MPNVSTHDSELARIQQERQARLSRFSQVAQRLQRLHTPTTSQQQPLPETTTPSIQPVTQFTKQDTHTSPKEKQIDYQQETSGLVARKRQASEPLATSPSKRLRHSSISCAANSQHNPQPGKSLV